MAYYSGSKTKTTKTLTTDEKTGKQVYQQNTPIEVVRNDRTNTPNTAVGKIVQSTLTARGANDTNAILGLIGANRRPSNNPLIADMQQFVATGNARAAQLSEQALYNKNAAEKVVLQSIGAATDLGVDALLAAANPLNAVLAPYLESAKAAGNAAKLAKLGRIQRFTAPGSYALASRAYGGAAYEAAQKGLDAKKQGISGVKSAAIELLTEAIGGPFAKIYGGTVLGKATDKLISRISKNAAAKFALEAVKNFSEEGIEEIMADVLNPLADKILKLDNGEGWEHLLDKENIEQMLYDGLIGGIVGLAGGAAQGLTGVAKQTYINSAINSALYESNVEGKSYADEMQEKVNARIKEITERRESARPAEATQSPVEAQTVSTQQVAPAVQETAQNMPPEVLNETPAERIRNASTEQAQNVTIETPAETRPMSPAEIMMAAGQQSQRGQTNGRTVSNNQQAGRQDVSPEVRPVETGNQGTSETLQGGQPDAGRTVDSGTPNAGEAERLKQHSERTVNFQNTIEKHAKGFSEKVRKAIGAKHINDFAPDDEIVQYISQNANGGNAGSLYEDLLIGNLIEGKNRSELASSLAEAGLTKEQINNVLNEALGNEEEDSLPFTVSDKSEAEKKTPSPAKTEIQVGKLKISKEKGHRVATVTDTKGSKPHIGGDVDTVRVAEKYVRKKGDIKKRGRNGYKLIQHGNTDNYTVLDKHGNIVGHYKEFEAANKAMGNKGGVFNVASFNLGDSIVEYNDGYVELDTDTAFTSSDYLTTQGKSLASDELGILTSRHGKVGYTGNTTANVLNVELSFEDFKEKVRSNPSSQYAKYNEKQLRMLWQKHFNTLLHGVKNEYGEYVRLPGIWGKNGKHYVFAGWTASKSRKGIAIFMEEEKYKQFRHRMTGGLSPSEIKNFNPAKFLTNQGTYWTPSEANTGVKVGNLIVMSDVFNIYHNVTRMFIRSSDIGSDVDALVKAGYTKEAAEAKVKSVKAGEAFMITGDLIVNTVDGFGMVHSPSLEGHDFQARGPGGVKGYMLNLNFRDFYNLNVPIDPNRAFTITDPETGEIVAGIRHVDKKTGVELMNKWGKWQRVNEAQGVIFDSTVKFAENYSVYKDVDGEQVIDPEASTQKFKDAMGDTDLRSIPIENIFGRSWDEDDEDAGRIRGYTRRSLAQLTRSVDGLPEAFAETLIQEGFVNPVQQALSTPEDFLRAIGVNDDSVDMPAGGSTLAYIAAADPDAFVNSNLGKKAALDFIRDLAQKARGGQLYLKNDEHAYQYISPDPFGLMNLMTQFSVQMEDAILGNIAEMKKSDNPLFDFALHGNQEIKNKTTKERYQGEIYSSKLAEGETMASRYPNNELTDSQIRLNVRNKLYEENLAKYGVGNTAAFFALNDTIGLNMDNDYDGDTSFLFQGGLMEANKKAQQLLGKSKNEKGRVVRNWEIFTERGKSKAEAKDITIWDNIVAAIAISLDAPSIAQMDEFINIINELPNSWLEEIGTNKRKLAAEFSTAYKLSYDFAKDGKIDPEFAKAIVDAQVSIMELLKRHGYYVDYEVATNPSAKGGKKNYQEVNIRFLPVPARYEFSNKVNKREKIKKAWEKQNYLNKIGAKGKTVIDPSDTLISQFYKNQLLSDIAPSERNKVSSDFIDSIKAIEKMFPWKHGEESFNYESISALPFSSYPDSEQLFDAIYTMGRYYTRVVNKKSGGENMRAALKTLYNAVGLDSFQFESLMSYAMHLSSDVDKYSSVGVFLNFDQDDGTTAVTDIIRDKMLKDGTLRRLERALNGIQSELHEVIKPYEEAKAYYNQMVATRSEELNLKREMQAQMAELDSEVEWLNNLLNKFKYSEKTFEDRVKRNNFVAAMMTQEEELKNFKRKVEETSERLEAMEDKAVSQYFMTEDTKERIRNLNREVKAARDAMNAKVDSTLLAIQMLNEAKEEYEARFEDVETKKWLAGYGRIGDTGVNEKRKQIDLYRKLDILFALSGAEVSDIELHPETRAFIEKNMKHLIDKVEDPSARINDKAQGWIYKLKPNVTEAQVRTWMDEKGSRLMQAEWGIDLSSKVIESADEADDIFDVPSESKEPSLLEYKEGKRLDKVENPKPPKKGKKSETKQANPTEGGEEVAPPEAVEPEPIKEEEQKPEPQPKAEPESEPEAEPEAEPVKEKPSSKPEVVPREATYGVRFKRVSEALNRISNGFGDGAQTIIPDSVEDYLGKEFGQARHDLYEFGKEVANAFNAEDDGDSLRAFAKELPDRIKSNASLHALLGDPEIGNVAKIAKRIVDSADSKNAYVFQNAAAEFAEVLAKEIESLPKTLEMLSTFAKAIEKSGKAAKFFASKSLGGRAASTYVGYMRNFVNIMMGLDNFDRFGKGPGYELAKMLEDAVFNSDTLNGNAIVKAMSAKQAFDQSDASKKKVKLEIIKKGQKEIHEISMADAVDFLHTIRTLEESKIDAWSKIAYYPKEGDSIRINNEGQFKNVKEALENAVLKDEAVKAYYDTFSDLYDMLSGPVEEAIAKASGRKVEMFAKGKYYPLWAFVEKAARSSKGFNFGMDDMLFTKNRIKDEGGAIRILDPTERFMTYLSLANKVVENSEFGATIERLNRSGLGENLEDIVTRRYGKGHADIVRQTVKNANDFRAESDEVSSLLRSIRLNVQTGALFGNFGSMAKQIASIMNAVGIVDMDDILYGISAAFNKEERDKASALGAIKNRYLGPFDPDVHDAFEGQTAFQKFYKNLSEKAPWLKVFSDGFQRVDSLAIKIIYLASRHNVMKQGMSETDDGFENKVLAKFKPAFLRTQPQFNKLLRPYVQVTENEMIRMFGMFKTQPLQNFNTMIRAVNEYTTAKSKYGADSKEFKEVSKQMSGVIAGQATASLLFGALGAIAKLLYHRNKDLEDEDGNLDAGKVMARVLMNAAEASGGMMIFGDSAVQFVIDRLSGGKTKEFYGLSAGSISSVIDAVEAISSFAEKPSRYGAKKAAGYIAQLFGIPLNNAYAILNSFIMYSKDIADGNDGNYDDILKYLDAQAKAAKKEEEKASKQAAKQEEKSGADVLAETAKQNSSQSELNLQEEKNEYKPSGYLTKPYNALISAGMSSQRSQEVLSQMDTDSNNSVKQAEMIAYWKAHPEDEKYVIAMWNSYGYKTTWEKAKQKAG